MMTLTGSSGVRNDLSFVQTTNAWLYLNLPSINIPLRLVLRITVSVTWLSTANFSTYFSFGLNTLGTLNQRTLTIGGCITEWLTSCLTGLDLTKQEKLLIIQHKQSSWNRSVSLTLILPLKLVFSGCINIFRSFKEGILCNTDFIYIFSCRLVLR